MGEHVEPVLWRQLLEYYSACARRSAVLDSTVEIGDRAVFEPLPAGAERVMTAGAEPLPLRGRMAVLAQRAKAVGRALRYGYPVLVSARSETHARSFAPLLMCDVVAGADGVLHTTPPIQMNRALARDHGLSEAVVNALSERVERCLEATQPGAEGLAQAIGHVVGTLGLVQREPLDPAALTGTLDSGPHDVDRVQNTAVLFAVDADTSAHGQLLAELTELAGDPTTIEDTALGVLLSPTREPAGESGPERITLVSARHLNEDQEETIRSVLGRRLTVLGRTSPDSASQVVTALVTTATAAGWTVLVGSADERSADEAVEYRPKRPPGEEDRVAHLDAIAAEVDLLRSNLDVLRVAERDLVEAAARRRDLEQSAPASMTSAVPEDERRLRQVVRRVEQSVASRWLGWWHRRRLRGFGACEPEQVEELGRLIETELRWRDCLRGLGDAPDEAECWPRLSDLVTRERPWASARLLSEWTWSETRCSLPALPLRPAAYDLAIVPGAASRTIPGVFSLLFRAKRALVIGEPRALTALATLPEAEDTGRQLASGLTAEWLEDRCLVFSRHSAYQALSQAAGGLQEPGEQPTGRAAQVLYSACLRSGVRVRRDVPVCGHRLDLVVGDPAGSAAVAVVVDDPRDDENGWDFRCLLSALDAVSRAMPVCRVAAWRCYAEPEVVVAELSANIRVSLGNTR